MGSYGMCVNKGGTRVHLWVGKIHRGWRGEDIPSGPYLFPRSCPLASASGPNSFSLQLPRDGTGPSSELPPAASASSELSATGSSSP